MRVQAIQDLLYYGDRNTNLTLTVHLAIMETIFANSPILDKLRPNVLKFWVCLVKFRPVPLQNTDG